MIKDLFYNICRNKNLLMLFSAFIYIISVLSALNNCVICVSVILTIIFIYLMLKNILPVKTAVVWIVIFYLGIVNTVFRLKDTDDLLNLAPRNATIYGKIISIPQNKDKVKQSFFFKVDKIEYDSLVKEFDNEKTLVTLNSEKKFNLYDSYKIRGRLSTPFKAGNPSQFDYGNYLRNFSTYAVFYGKNPYGWEGNEECFEKSDAKLKPYEKFLQGINNYRERVIQIHSNYLKSPNLEILGGIVFGDDAVTPPKDIKQSFINSGLLHILAASGMNVAFIFSFFFFILNLIRIDYKINICICMLAVITYVLMTGMGASVLRAGLMLLFVLIGKLVDRDAHSISLLSFVALLLLIYNPMLLNDVGFQLSFIVTFGLLIVTPYLTRYSNRFINWIVGTISIPIIAQLWVMPIQIYYFNNISLYSVFANIMSVPILSVISFGGFISSLLCGIPHASHFICRLFDLFLNPLISMLVNISDFWGKLPYSAIQTTHPNVFQILLYYGLLFCLIGFIDKNIRSNYSKLLKIVTSVFLLILCISMVQIKNTNLEITAFDVGNADSFLIKTPKNEYIMIDTGKNGYNGGKSQAEMIILKYFKDTGIKNIDTLIVTHFDNDHCGGTADLIENLNIKNLYVNSLNHDSKAAKEIYAKARDKNVNLIEAQNNQEIVNSQGFFIKNYIVKDVAGIGDNESSIVTLLTCGDFTALFTGDAGIGTFEKIKKDIPRNLTLLKVGHHGASGVVNKEMIDYLNPQISLISTGENKFGHPSMYTIETLKNTQILRTDINNSIKLVIKPNNYKIYTYNSLKRKFVKL